MDIKGVTVEGTTLDSPFPNQVQKRAFAFEEALSRTTTVQIFIFNKKLKHVSVKLKIK